MSLKLKYIQLVLKLKEEQHKQKLQPLIQNIQTNKIEEGIFSDVVLDSLTSLHYFYNNITSTHSFYSQLTSILLKYIEYLKSTETIQFTQKQLLYFIQLFNHPKECSLHEEIFNCLISLLNKDDIKLILQALNSVSFDAYKTDERKQIIDILQKKHSTEEITKAIILLLNEEITIKDIEIVEKSNYSEKLEYQTEKAKNDEKNIDQLKTTLNEIFVGEKLSIGNYYSIIIEAVKIVSLKEPRILDEFRIFCTNKSIEEKKLKMIVKLFAPIVSEDYLNRFIETSKIQIADLCRSDDKQTQLDSLIRFIGYFCL